MKAWEFFLFLALSCFAGMIIAIVDVWVHWLILSIGGVGIVSVILTIFLHSKSSKQYFQ